MARQYRSILFAALFVSLVLQPAFPSPGGAAEAGGTGDLRVAAVQLQIRASDLRSFDVFQAHIESLVRSSMAFHPDLIVFPEYTSVFLALIPYYEQIRSSQSIEQGFTRIEAADPLVGEFRQLFLLNSGMVQRAMRRIFASAAEEYGVAILAGTYFAWEQRNDEIVLVNRAVLYGSGGEPAYTQDKVYLTPFEEQLLGISPGRLQEAEPIQIRGRRIGITICRDTFFPAWGRVHAGVDLWIDIKANGTAYTEEERERFLRAVPARIEEADIPYGMTVCLTGSLLDLLWEGESSLVLSDPHAGLRFLDRAQSASAEQVLFFTIPEPTEALPAGGGDFSRPH